MNTTNSAVADANMSAAQPQNQGKEIAGAGAERSAQGVLSLPVRIFVSVGGARMRFRDILDLTPDKIINLDSTVGDPVEIYAGERLIARGDLVEAESGSENLGVRITELVDGD